MLHQAAASRKRGTADETSNPLYFPGRASLLCSIPVVNALGYFAEKAIGSKNDQFAANLSVWARK